VAVLLAALLGARPLAAVVLAVPPVRQTLSVIPLPVRFLLGFGLTFLVARPIVALWLEGNFDPPFGSEFLPVVISTALGVLIFAILLGVRPEPAGAAPAPRGTRTLMMLGLIALIAVMLWLGTPEPVAAGDCSGLTDCFSGGQAGTAAAAGAAAAAAAIAGSRGIDRVGRKMLDSMGFPEEGAPTAGGQPAATTTPAEAAAVEAPSATDSPVADSPTAETATTEPRATATTTEAPMADTPTTQAPATDAPTAEAATPAGDDGLGGKAQTLSEAGPTVDQPTAQAPETPPAEPAQPAPEVPAAEVGPTPVAADQAVDDGLGGKARSLGDVPTEELPSDAQPPAGEQPTAAQPPAETFTRPDASEATESSGERRRGEKQ
jgi:hypothetical protein